MQDTHIISDDEPDVSQFTRIASSKQIKIAVALVMLAVLFGPVVGCAAGYHMGFEAGAHPERQSHLGYYPPPESYLEKKKTNE